MINGIDLSHHKSVYDYDAVIRDPKNISFVMHKLGGSEKGFCKIDELFGERYEEFTSRGIGFGAYFFTGSKFATLKGHGVECAEWTLSVLRQYPLIDWPIILDVEWASNKSRIWMMANRGRLYANVREYLETVENAGYFTGIYTSDIAGWSELLKDCHNDLKRYAHWVARYGRQPSNCTDWSIWQHSSTGDVNGIAGRVDMNVARYDIGEVIRRKHLNNIK